MCSSVSRLAFCPVDDTSSFTEVLLPPISMPGDTPTPITMMALAPGNTPNQAVVYVLADGPRLWRVRDTTADEVQDLPADLFSDQATYDMAIAVHPTSEDVLVLGGCGIELAESYDAALFVGRVLKSAAGGFSFLGINAPAGLPRGFVGLGVHADVHDLSWVPGGGAGPELFVACDGGVFRSAPNDLVGPFDDRNSGIGSIEAQYIAQHPTSDAVLLVGTQDNGGIRPVSPEAWTLATFGDAGGVAIDPLNPQRQFAQYTDCRWFSSIDGGVTFTAVTLFSAPPAGADADLVDKFTKAYDNEKKKGSPPYCTAAAIANGTVTQLAVATDRVWYSENWGVTWVTLPSGKNPYDPTSVPTAPDRRHDAMEDRPVGYVLKWATPDALLVMHQDGIYLYSRASTPGSPWTRTRRYNRPEVKRASNKKGTPPDGQIRADMPLTDLASHDPNRAGLGSLYASTSGEKDDHVWWFDGQGHWLRTHLPVDVPVHALAVDPAHRDVVYAGTDIGVWKGVGTIPGPGAGEPHWDWTHYSNGLPEAACIDLVIHPEARLLRAALRGRGVWEVALDDVKQKPTAYLRAHRYDTRRVLPLPQPAGSDAARPGLPAAAAAGRLSRPEGVPRGRHRAPTLPRRGLRRVRRLGAAVTAAGARQAHRSRTACSTPSPGPPMPRSHRRRAPKPNGNPGSAGPIPTSRPSTTTRPTPAISPSTCARNRTAAPRPRRPAPPAPGTHGCSSSCTTATSGRWRPTRSPVSCCAPRSSVAQTSPGTPRCRRDGQRRCARTSRAALRAPGSRTRSGPTWTPSPRSADPPGRSTSGMRRWSSSPCPRRPGRSATGCCSPSCTPTRTSSPPPKPTSPSWSAPAGTPRPAPCTGSRRERLVRRSDCWIGRSMHQPCQMAAMCSAVKLPSPAGRMLHVRTSLPSFCRSFS